MTRSLFATVSALSLIAAAPALADVTAADVWQNSNAIFEAMGGKVSADASTEDATTTYQAHTINIPLPMGIGEVTVAMPDTALHENGDGTVTMSYPNGYNISVATEIYGEGHAEIGFTGNVGDMSFEASGTPGTVTYLSGDADMTLKLANVVVNGEPFNDASFTMAISSAGATGSMTITETDDLVSVSIESAAETTTMAWDYHVVGYESGEASTLVTNGTGIIDLAIPTTGVDVMNLSPALRDGLSLYFLNTVEASTTVTTIKDTLGINTSEQRTTQGPTQIAASLGDEGIGLVADSNLFELSLQEQIFPVPISVSLEKLSLFWQIPLLASPEPQDVVINTTFSGVTFAPQLWNLLDPAEILDRSPITFGADIAAQAILDIDLLDIAALGELDQTGGLPGTVPSVTLDSFVAEALGAVITADAAFDIDFEPMQFFGTPVPTGVLNFTATGVNAAIEALVQSGLVSSEDTMAITFGIGMIGRPVGDDAYEGTLEITEDGQFLANGTPLQ